MGSRDCEDTFFRKILEQFGVSLDWVSEIFSNLGRSRTSSVGLRRLLECMGLGRVYKYFVLRGLRLWAGSRRLGFKPNKKAKKMRYGLGCGSDDYLAGLEFDTSGLSSLAPKALDSSTKSFPAIKSGSLSVEAYLPLVCQKVVVPIGGALDCSTGTFPTFKSYSLSMGFLLSPLQWIF